MGKAETHVFRAYRLDTQASERVEKTQTLDSVSASENSGDLGVRSGWLRRVSVIVSVTMATYTWAQKAPRLPVRAHEVPHMLSTAIPLTRAARRGLLFAQRSAVGKGLHLLVLGRMSRLRT